MDLGMPIHRFLFHFRSLEKIAKVNVFRGKDSDPIHCTVCLVGRVASEQLVTDNVGQLFVMSQHPFF